jgi:hypothetical protein
VLGKFTLGKEVYYPIKYSNPKIGRNTKVNVKYINGKIVKNVKYKKVVADIEKGNCSVSLD